MRSNRCVLARWCKTSLTRKLQWLRSKPRPINMSERNFMQKQSKTPSGDNRRTFIKKTAAAGAAVAATGFLKTPVYGQGNAPSANVAGANNKITVAVIGVGFGIGKNHFEG